eukprot:1793783-Pyramimonas_sp.AAC.1
MVALCTSSRRLRDSKAVRPSGDSCLGDGTGQKVRLRDAPAIGARHGQVRPPPTGVLGGSTRR